jgi:hypothetical protein
MSTLPWLHEEVSPSADFRTTQGSEKIHMDTDDIDRNSWALLPHR